MLRVFLKYGPEGERVIRHIQRASKPGLRRYVHSKDLRPVLDQLVETACRLCSATRGFIYRNVGGMVRCAAAFNIAPKHRQNMERISFTPGRAGVTARAKTMGRSSK